MIRKIVMIQLTAFLRSFFTELGSDLDTDINPFIFLVNGSRQDKSYGLGRVGFPQTEPAVAAQAVSV